MDPAGKQGQRDVDRRQEQQDEHGHLNHRARLLGAKEHRETAPPQRRDKVEEDPESEQAQQVGPGPIDVHPGDQGSERHNGAGDQPAQEGSDGVAGNDSAPAGSAQQEAPGESRFEVARDGKAREHASERRRLEEHEHVLE